MTMGTRVRFTVILGILGLLLLAAVLWLFILAPRLDQAAAIEQETEAVASQNTALQGRYNQALRQAREAPQSAAEAVDLYTSMPREADLPRILEQIPDAAKAAGIAPTDLTSLSTGLPVPVVAGTDPGANDVQLATIGLQVSAVGSRASLLDFVDRLRTLDRAVLVKGTSYSSAPGRAQDTVTIDADMFVLQSQLPDLVQKVDDLLAKADLPAAPAG